MSVDLNLFCYKWDGPDYKEKYSIPWPEEHFSYASDGSILIRVCRLPDILENKLVQSVVNAQKISGFLNKDVDMWFRVPDITPGKMVCEDCEGTGKRDYVDCEECGGNGYVDEEIVVKIEGVFFNNKYLRMLLTLPDVKMALVDKTGAPAKFRFDGGDGLVMPMFAPNRYDYVKLVEYAEIQPWETIA